MDQSDIGTPKGSLLRIRLIHGVLGAALSLNLDEMVD